MKKAIFILAIFALNFAGAWKPTTKVDKCFEETWRIPVCKYVEGVTSPSDYMECFEAHRQSCCDTYKKGTKYSVEKGVCVK